MSISTLIRCDLLLLLFLIPHTFSASSSTTQPPLSSTQPATQTATQNTTSSLLNQSITDEDVFRMMYEAQDRFRTDNYQKAPREFDVDWELCEETYRWPECCLWEDKKRHARGTSRCTHIKGDVILDNDHDAQHFQAFVDILQIQGRLVLRNTSLHAFGMPHLSRVGFAGPNPLNISAGITVENNKNLLQFRLRRLKQIAINTTQMVYGRFVNNPNLHIDAKQYQIFCEASKMSLDFEQFKPPQHRYVRFVLTEVYPYILFGAMIIGVFTYHFTMLEVNESRIKKKEAEMIDCIVQMRDSTLAAELLLQTPSDVLLTFDKDVLHLCTDQVNLIQQIDKLLNGNDKSPKKTELSEMTAKEKTQ